MISSKPSSNFTQMYNFKACNMLLMNLVRIMILSLEPLLFLQCDWSLYHKTLVKLEITILSYRSNCMWTLICVKIEIFAFFAVFVPFCKFFQSFSCCCQNGWHSLLMGALQVHFVNEACCFHDIRLVDTTAWVKIKVPQTDDFFLN